MSARSRSRGGRRGRKNRGVSDGQSDNPGTSSSDSDSDSMDLESKPESGGAQRGTDVPETQDGSRDRLGRFKAGRTGNPEGRNQHTRRGDQRRELLDLVKDLDLGPVPPEDAQVILKKLISMAKEGDAFALREVNSRIWPVQRDERSAVTLRLINLSGIALEKVVQDMQARGVDPRSLDTGVELPPPPDPHVAASELELWQKQVEQMTSPPGTPEDPRTPSARSETQAIIPLQPQGPAEPRTYGRIERPPQTAWQAEKEAERWGDDDKPPDDDDKIVVDV